MSLVTIEAIVKVYCKKCGEGLKAHANRDEVVVELCRCCMEREYERGIKDERWKKKEEK